MKTISGKGVGPPKVASRPAPGLAPKNGGMKSGTKQGAGASGQPPPKTKLPMHGGNFSHPKGSY